MDLPSAAYSSTSLLMARNFAVAVAIGLLIGLERGWQQREARSGQRVAGLRTFAIIGVTGGANGLLAHQMGAILLGTGIFAVAGMLVAAQIISTRETQSYGITSEMAAFATYILAALATAGAPILAATGSVIVATLLSFKPELHRWLEWLDRDELIAVFELLMISVIVLPLLPDRGMGPWSALNPFKIWLLVVLVATISFAGHFAVRLLGHRRGIFTTGIFGGLASSTALTLHFARLSRRARGLDTLLAIGIILAQAMSMPRMVVVALFVNPLLAQAAAIALILLTAVELAGALILRTRLDTAVLRAPRKLGPPFQLKETLRFAILFITVTLISAAGVHLFGETSIYAIAAVAGIGNLTAITLSIAQLGQTDIATHTAVQALVIAAVSSVLFKSLLAYMLGGRRLGLLVGASAVGVAVTGVVILYIIFRLPTLWLG